MPLREEAIRADHRAALDAIGAADKLRGSAVAFRVVAGFYDRAVVRAWATWRVFDRAAQQAAAAARHKREAAAAREAHILTASLALALKKGARTQLGAWLAWRAVVAQQRDDEAKGKHAAELAALRAARKEQGARLLYLSTEAAARRFHEHRLGRALKWWQLVTFDHREQAASHTRCCFDMPVRWAMLC